MDAHYDVIIVGTGFAGAFFLMRYLERAPALARVLVLERGREDSKSWQLQHQATTSIGAEKLFVNRTPDHSWHASPGFGGNSKCWWAGAMRMMPNDFRLRSEYGVGDDWPVSYAELEPHYSRAEHVMLVSGPNDAPMPRSQGYPLPAHRFSTPDVHLKKHFPNGWFHVATARASVPTGSRGVCCANGICDLCPHDAKFTIQNGLAHIYADPRVTLLLESTAERVDIRGDTATAVWFSRDGRPEKAHADLVVLAASALFNPHLLMRSGVRHRLLGKRLHEQLGVDACVDLNGLGAYDGSTVITANGYVFYDGPHRRDYAGCMIESWNSPFPNQAGALRAERGRWRQRQFFRFIFDELPSEENTITVGTDDASLAEISFHGFSDYARRGAERVPKMLDRLAAALPIERVVRISPVNGLGHIQGTTVMGTDPARSVVDRNLVHHEVRNLVVLGAGAFPTATPILPTLTISALSLWAADRLFDPGVHI
jgi:choline dehydrogenase-like flavoprotein